MPRPESSAATTAVLADTARGGVANSREGVRALAAIDRLAAENNRLREALTYYAEGRYPDGGEIAREALT